MLLTRLPFDINQTWQVRHANRVAVSSNYFITRVQPLFVEN
jgi:hypothetical protein